VAITFARTQRLGTCPDKGDERTRRRDDDEQDSQQGCTASRKQGKAQDDLIPGGE
jgi:hypothetical protein